MNLIIWSNSGRETDAYMKFATILYLFIIYLYIHLPLGEYLAEFPTILDSFYLRS